MTFCEATEELETNAFRASGFAVLDRSSATACSTFRRRPADNCTDQNFDCLRTWHALANPRSKCRNKHRASAWCRTWTV